MPSRSAKHLSLFTCGTTIWPGRPGCAVVGADEVEDGLGGLDEVGMAGDLGVRLRLLHAPQLRTAVTAPQ